MSSLPTGTVTFLFTDIEGSTRLLQDLGDRYAQVLADYRQLLRTASARGDGYEVDTQGDAIFLVFPRAKDALAAAVAAQRAICSHQWPGGLSVRVRMGLHTGEPVGAATGYVGMDVHRAARICAAGHGGQMLLSDTTQALVAKELPEGVSLRDLGEHRLKDLAHPHRLFQVMLADFPTEFPPLKSLEALPNNLPIQLTSFIGRDQEIAEIKRLLDTTRLLTLTGTGGSGKTRLALQVGSDLLESFEGGVWLVELASLSDPDLVPQTAASALGVREQAGRSILATLIDSLRPKHLLLVLDNCEHLLSACATLSDTLLRACPELRMLATSREGLGIAGELSYHVPSLSVPDLRHLPPLERLADHDAVRLFIERARFAQSTFTMTETNGSAVAQICHRLDGIPLAIELAAARVKSMSVERIAERLTDRFRLLAGGSRTALRRHQTLRDAIDWSYDLLSEQERIALRRLAVFIGGFTVDAAEAVCRGDRIAEGDVLDLLTHLVDKSLVMIEQGSQERYRMLETIREYALDRLHEAGELEELWRRHRDFFQALAEESYAALVGSASPQWLRRLRDEHDNIRTALRWSLDHEDVERAADMAAAMSRFWEIRGFYSEGRAWLQELLEKGQHLSLRARAKVLTGAGLLALGPGDLVQAVRLSEEGLALFRELGDQEELMRSLSLAGFCNMWVGNYERADALLDESAALARQRGDLFMVASALNQRGYVAARRSDYGLATTLLEESLPYLRRFSSKQTIGFPLCRLGLVKYYQGEFKQANELFQEALIGFRELEDPEGIVWALNGLGRVLRSMGDHESAAEVYRESLIICSEVGLQWEMTECLVGIAVLGISEGRAGWSVRLLAAANALLKATEVVSTVADQAEFDQLVTRLRGNLGEEAFAAAWTEGRAMTMKQAVEYALKSGGRWRT